MARIVQYQKEAEVGQQMCPRGLEGQIMES